MTAGLIAHGVLSCLSGLSVSVTGFGCDIARELLHLVVAGDDVYAPASAINMGLAAALVTAVQVTHWVVCSREEVICCCLSLACSHACLSQRSVRICGWLRTKCGEIE